MASAPKMQKSMKVQASANKSPGKKKRGKGFRLTLIPRRWRRQEWMKTQRKWGCFYTSRELPQAHNHSVQAVIFHQTHLKCKIGFLMAQILFWFPSTLPFHFLIFDMPILPYRLLSSGAMRDPSNTPAGSHQYGQKRSPSAGVVVFR